MNQSVHRFLIAMILALLIGGCATGGGSGGEQGESEENQAANANMQLGVQYLRRGELQKALSKLKKARAQAPDNANTQMMLGVVYSRLDKPALARDGFERAVELTPDNSQALNNYGKFLCQRGEFDRAGELFGSDSEREIRVSGDLLLTDQTKRDECDQHVGKRRHRDRYVDRLPEGLNGIHDAILVVEEELPALEGDERDARSDERPDGMRK